MLTILPRFVQLIIKKHLFCDSEVQTIMLTNEFDFIPDLVMENTDDNNSNGR